MVRGLRSRPAPRSRSTAARCAGGSRPATSPASFSCTSSERPGTIPSNMRSMCSAIPEAVRTARCPARTTRMPGRPTATPDCRRRRPGERVILWVQNSHPTPIPAGAIGLNPMGEERVVALRPSRSVRSPAAPSMSPSCCRIFPGRGRSNCAPASMSCGRATRFSPASGAASRMSMSSATICGPTRNCPISPAARQRLSAARPDPAGNRVGKPAAAHPDGAVADRAAAGRDRLRPRGKRSGATAARPDAARPRDGAALGEPRNSASDYGHVELVYDFAQGWRRAATAGCTRCSAIAIATAGTSPKPASARMCSTRCWSIAASRNPMPARRRAFRRGCFCVSETASYDTLCHLIYPASRPWRPLSATEIILHDRLGREVARAALAIPCSGSRLFRYHELFDAETRARAGDGRLRDHSRHNLPPVRVSRAARAATARSASTTCSAFDRELTRTVIRPGRGSREKCYIAMSN